MPELISDVLPAVGDAAKHGRQPDSFATTDYLGTYRKTEAVEHTAADSTGKAQDCDIRKTVSDSVP